MSTHNGMNLWRNTFYPATEFRCEFDRLFDDWKTSTARGLRTDSHFVPVCEVEEQDDHYLLTLEMAGVRKDDIKMEVVDSQIVISGERQSDTRKQAGLTYSERRFGKFQRTFALPVGVDVGQVEANYQDGILRIVIPKAESAKPRQIKIGNGNAASKFFGKFLNQPKEPKGNEDQHTLSHSGRVTDQVAS